MYAIIQSYGSELIGEKELKTRCLEFITTHEAYINQTDLEKLGLSHVASHFHRSLPKIKRPPQVMSSPMIMVNDDVTRSYNFNIRIEKCETLKRTILPSVRFRQTSDEKEEEEEIEDVKLSLNDSLNLTQAFRLTMFISSQLTDEDDRIIAIVAGEKLTLNT